MARKVFISYASEDNGKMKMLQRSIEKNLKDKYEAIIIADKKEPGKPLTVKVTNGLNEAHFFIPILTNNSIKNQWVNQEIGFATAIMDSVNKIALLPIVGDDIVDELKGFIHKHVDLPFTFVTNTSSSPKERASFKKSCEDVSQYLYRLIPQKKEVIFNKKTIDTNKLKGLMYKIYQKYKLPNTKLLDPEHNDIHLSTHSHAGKNYFDYLIHESCQEYSFKYFDNQDKNRYLIVHVNNTKPEIKLELNLTQQENAEIELEIDRLLGNVEVKKGKFTDDFLQKQVDYTSLLAYANLRYKDFEHDDHKINNLLWQDLNKDKYKTLEDIDQVVEKAKPAVDAYYKHDPSSFISGTDFLTKSFGFVDRDFRQRHPFGRETRNAFVKYSELIK
jgi:hypothetical protein